MAIESVFRDLTDQLLKLQEALTALRVAIGDKPERGESALADCFENTVLDAMGIVHEAQSAAQQAQRAARNMVDLDAARRALATSQDRFHRMSQDFSNSLASYAKLWELARLGRERGGEWRSWTGSVKQSIDDCQPPILDASKALSGCWQELVEHNGRTSISIRSRNLGQKTVVHSAGPSTTGPGIGTDDQLRMQTTNS